MAFTRYLMLEFNPTITVREFIPGSGPSGIWTPFPVQPPPGWGYGLGRFVCGLKDGSIIVRDDAGFRHYDPLTLMWVTRSIGGLGRPNEVLCVGPAGIDAISGSGYGQVGGYNGTTQTWSMLGAFEPTLCRVAGNSLTNVWAAFTSGTGTGELRHFNGTIWTNHRAEVTAFLGWSPWGFDQIMMRPDGVLYVAVSGGPTYVHLIRRSVAGVWSTAVTGNIDVWGVLASRGLWSTADDRIWMTGPDGYGQDDWLIHWNGLTLAKVRKIGQYSAPYASNALTGIDFNRLLEMGTRYWPAELGITESLDGGGTWIKAGVQPGLYEWDWGQISPGGWAEEAAPIISNKVPAPGATDVPLTDPVSFDVTDVGSGVNAAATTISLAGTPAWAADAPLPGFTGSRSAIPNGYHYSINRISGWLPGEAVAVAVHAEDTVGNAVNASWSFTASTFAVTSLDPSLIDELGGTLITISGLFPLGETFSVYLGPVTPANLCYSGRQGYGSHPESVDGLALQCVSVPSAIGVQTVTVVRDSNLAVSTLPITVVERNHQSKRLSTRACHPPWAGVGPRRIEED
jgi:hypothetical protein